MISNDGYYTFYRIQHKTDEKGYVFSDLDYFGYGDHLKDFDKGVGFNASGDCWQTTGVNGTFERSAARRLKRHLDRKWPKERFRIVQIFIRQTTKPI